MRFTLAPPGLFEEVGVEGEEAVEEERLTAAALA